MEGLRFLLKFGEKKHMERLAEGYLYFSNAKSFRKIEEKLLIKGQGDLNENVIEIPATSFVAKYPGTDDVAFEVNTHSAVNLFNAESDDYPVMCFYACTDEDCNLEDGKYKLNLSEETKDTIKQHFPKADTVAIINSPEIFIEDCEKTLKELKHEHVNYFKLHNTKYLDGRYMAYLFNISINNLGNMNSFSFRNSEAYRLLFCKDEYFKSEKEYRFVLNLRTKDLPKDYKINTTSDIILKDIEDL